MELELKDKVVVVTGGGTGIGHDISRLFCEAGSRVVIASRNPEHLEPAKEAFAAEGHTVDTYVLDITQPEAIQAFGDHLKTNYQRLDVLVNNAGANFICSVRKMSVNGWLSVININLNGTFFCSKILGEMMIESGNPGSIINMVATYGWTGAPGNAHSSSAKAGIIALTKSLAAEWAQFGIRVNAVAPGPIETPIAVKQLKFLAPGVLDKIKEDVPMQRLGTPEEAARAVLFLSSEKWASYITGEVMVVDGGHVLFSGIDPTSYLEKNDP